VQRLEHLVARHIAPPVAGNHTTAMHNVHAIHVAFDRDRFKRVRARYAVLHVLESHQLILVDFRRPRHAWIEGVPGQRFRGFAISIKEFANRAFASVASALTLCEATVEKIRIQLVEILHLGNRRRPATL